MSPVLQFPTTVNFIYWYSWQKANHVKAYKLKDKAIWSIIQDGGNKTGGIVQDNGWKLLSAKTLKRKLTFWELRKAFDMLWTSDDFASYQAK